MTQVSSLYKKPNEKLFKNSSFIAPKDNTTESNVVEKVIQDIVDYVIRKEELSAFKIPYDSDYIPSAVQENRNEPCTRLCCEKGCVCDSLSQKVTIKHCKKEDCIFHCICDRRLLYSLRNLPHRKSLKIMSNSFNHTLTSENGSENKPKPPKRCKRLPEYSDPSKEIPFIDLSMEEDTPEIPIIEIMDDEIDGKMELNVNIGPAFLPTDSLHSTELVTIERELLSYRKMFVWCSIHSIYKCPCEGQMFNLQKNLLMKDPKTEMASRHHFFSLENHCARTIGSIFDYRLRNRNGVFGVKRRFEIKSGILSNSNSFFKIDPLPQLNGKSAPCKIHKKKRTGFLLKTGSSHIIHSDCNPISVDYTEINSGIKLIFHDNSDSSEEEIEDRYSILPKFGLFCLDGYGYLPIKEYNSKKLVFQHPFIKKIFVSKKDLEEANLWLNDFLRGFMNPESQYRTLSWVVVRRGVLKIAKPFNLKKFHANLKKTDLCPVN